MRKIVLIPVAHAMAVTMASAVTMEMVTVGDTNNPSDPATGSGSVAYAYQIGKYEVMNSQYAEFLNSVAATDTYGLYNTSMGSGDARGGIDRSGTSGSYTYSVKSGYENMPVVYVSFYDAVRFANWLENGQPVGAQGVGTTETGSYTLFTSGSITTNMSGRTSSGWVIPTANEWYKAAYYDPGPSGPSDAYWLYPSQSDSIPNSRPPNGTDANSANFYRDDGSPDDFLNDGYAKTGSTSFYLGTNYMADVGSYTAADSHYGTFDQGGNAWEWNESIIGSDPNLLGGYMSSAEDRLRSSYLSGRISPTVEVFYVGFRVAIPEPSCVVGVLIVALGLCAHRLRRHSR